MSTQKFFVVPNTQTGKNKPNGIIKSKDKIELGIVYNNFAPDGRKYLTATLNGHWIITDEEMKLFKQLRKNHE
jgi:uncharacterized protein (DUF736 family)